MRYTDGQPVKRVVKELCYYGREEPIDTCLRFYVWLSVWLPRGKCIFIAVQGLSVYNQEGIFEMNFKYR